MMEKLIEKLRGIDIRYAMGFVLEIIGKAADELVRLQSEQTANLCTTDACESLRARLAKYEDAEGRTLQPAADLARRIYQAITDFTSGRACMHVPPFDTDVDIVLSECLKLANALESQAREIVRLNAEAMYSAAAYAAACEEIDRLKAQSCGVVSKAELIDALEEVWERSYDFPAAFALAAKGLAEELNSSPVSAGDREALLYLMDRFDNEVWVCTRCSHEEPTNEMDSAHYLREYLAGEPCQAANGQCPGDGVSACKKCPEKAGGVDERE